MRTEQTIIWKEQGPGESRPDVLKTADDTETGFFKGLWELKIYLMGLRFGKTATLL